MKAIALLAYPLLWPVVKFDYRQRQTGKRPDRWHWADAFLARNGLFVR